MCPETISKKCDLPVSLYPLIVTLKRDLHSIVASVDRLFAYSNEKEKIMAEVMTAQATLEPIVTDVTGVATFVERAREGRITLFI
jgi:hypothetical protein